MSTSPPLLSAADLSPWFLRQSPERAHLEIDYAGDAVRVAQGLVRLAAGRLGGLALVRGRSLTDRPDRLSGVVREAEAEVCPGAVAQIEVVRSLTPAVLVEVRPGTLTPPSPIPPELRPALGYGLRDLDPEGLRALRAVSEAKPGGDWPNHVAGLERTLFGLGLARTFAGAVVPTVAGLLALGGPDGTPPELLRVVIERPGKPPRERRAWLWAQIETIGEETWIWRGLSDEIAAWAVARALTTRALAGPRAAKPVRVRRGQTKVAIFIPREPAADPERANPHLRALVERLGLVAAPLSMEGGERLLAERGHLGPAEAVDEGGVWLRLPHEASRFAPVVQGRAAPRSEGQPPRAAPAVTQPVTPSVSQAAPASAAPTAARGLLPPPRKRAEVAADALPPSMQTRPSAIPAAQGAPAKGPGSTAPSPLSPLSPLSPVGPSGGSGAPLARPMMVSPPAPPTFPAAPPPPVGASKAPVTTPKIPLSPLSPLPSPTAEPDPPPRSTTPSPAEPLGQRDASEAPLTTPTISPSPLSPAPERSPSTPLPSPSPLSPPSPPSPLSPLSPPSAAPPAPRPAPPRARYVPARERERAVLDVLRGASNPLSTRELADALDWEPHRVAAVLYPLADAGRVLRTNPERRASNQRYALAPDASQGAVEPESEPAP